MIGETQPNVLSSTSLKGAKVLNQDGEKIGKIHELMIDLDYGLISYAVLQFGGVMGIKDKLFAIPWDAFNVEEDGKKFILNVSKRALEEAQGFDQDNWPQTADYKWLRQTYDYYNAEPYWY
jgi:sporulation protein YlmC with PRC-barrel domain